MSGNICKGKNCKKTISNDKKYCALCQQKKHETTMKNAKIVMVTATSIGVAFTNRDKLKDFSETILTGASDAVKKS